MNKHESFIEQSPLDNLLMWNRSLEISLETPPPNKHTNIERYFKKQKKQLRELKWRKNRRRVNQLKRKKSQLTNHPYKTILSCHHHHYPRNPNKSLSLYLRVIHATPDPKPNIEKWLKRANTCLVINEDSKTIKMETSILLPHPQLVLNDTIKCHPLLRHLV